MNKVEEMDAKIEQLIAENYSPIESNDPPPAQDAEAVNEVVADPAPNLGQTEEVVTETQEEIVPENEHDQQQIAIDGLTPEQYSERLRNAQKASIDSEKSYKHAQAKMTQALQAQSDMKTSLDGLKAEFDAYKLTHPSSLPETIDIQSAPPKPDESQGQSIYDQVVEEFGEDSVFAKMAQQQGQNKPDPNVDLQNEINSLKEQLALNEQNRVRQQGLDAVLRVHPDAMELSKSTAFNSWVSRQDEFTFNKLEKGDSNDVISVLSNYKLATGQQQTIPQDVRQNMDTNIRNQRQIPEPQLSINDWSKMSPEEFLKNEALIDKQWASGEF